MTIIIFIDLFVVYSVLNPESVFISLLDTSNFTCFSSDLHDIVIPLWNIH